MKFGMSSSELSSSSGGSSCKRVIKCPLKFALNFHQIWANFMAGHHLSLWFLFCCSANRRNQNLMAFDRARFRVVSVSSVSNASRVRRLNGTQVPPSRCQRAFRPDEVDYYLYGARILGALFYSSEEQDRNANLPRCHVKWLTL